VRFPCAAAMAASAPQRETPWLMCRPMHGGCDAHPAPDTTPCRQLLPAARACGVPSGTLARRSRPRRAGGCVQADYGLPFTKQSRCRCRCRCVQAEARPLPRRGACTGSRLPLAPRTGRRHTHTHTLHGGRVAVVVAIAGGWHLHIMPVLEVTAPVHFDPLVATAGTRCRAPRPFGRPRSRGVGRHVALGGVFKPVAFLHYASGSSTTS